MATTEVLDLRDYVQMLWRRRTWIVVTTLVVAGVALGQALIQPKTYQSIAKVLVLPATVPGAAVAPNQVISMPNELEVARSATVAADVESELGERTGTIDVSNPTDTHILVFEGYAQVPEAAQATAREYADAYSALRSSNLLSSITDRLDSVTTLVGQLVTKQDTLLANLADATDEAQKEAIREELATVASELDLRRQEQNELDLAGSAPVTRDLQEATFPQGPYSPRPLQTLVLATFIGLLLGIALAFVRDRLDQRVDSREDAELVTQAPVLGHVPKAASLHRLIAVAKGGDASAAEAFRSLRTRLLFGASKDGFRTIMVSSALAGEGKTTTAANIAVALAQAENKVVLVSGDLHHPGLWRYFPERGLNGLADALAGAVSLESVIVPTPHENLMFVPSGTLEVVPEAALGSSEMLHTLTQLAERADFVVLDAPPTLGVSDALDLASLVDGVILTVDATQARKDVVRDCVNELRSVGATLIGSVLTRVEPGHFGRYTYYGQQGRRESAHETPPQQEPNESPRPQGRPQTRPQPRTPTGPTAPDGGPRRISVPAEPPRPARPTLPSGGQAVTAERGAQPTGPSSGPPTAQANARAEAHADPRSNANAAGPTNAEIPPRRDTAAQSDQQTRG